MAWRGVFFCFGGGGDGKWGFPILRYLDLDLDDDDGDGDDDEEEEEIMDVAMAARAPVSESTTLVLF